MRTSAMFAGLLVLALMATSEAAFCHTSAYKVACSEVEAAKTKLWAACKADTPGGITPQGGFTENGSCCTVVQQTTDEATWNTYSKCEKSAANAATYGPLKAAPCDALKKSAAC